MENHRILDWLSARTIESSRANYRREIKRLARFAAQRGKDLYAIVDQYRAARRSGSNEAEDFIDSWKDIIRAYTTHINSLPDAAPLSRKNYLSIIKSYLTYHEIPIRVDLPRRVAVFYHNRSIRKEEIRLILSNATLRDRVIFLFMVESGIRGDTLTKLRYEHIREDYEKGTVPMMVQTPAEILKDRVANRFSFIGEDAFRALQEYLKPRGTLQDQDLLFASEKPGKVNLKKRKNFSAGSLSVKFNRLARKLKLDKQTHPGKPGKITLHSLRKYFRNNMKADSAWINFWMGHSLGTDEHYITHEPEVRHRELYAQGYPSLRIYESMETKDTEIQELREEIKFIKEHSDLLERVIEAGNPTQEQKKMILEWVIKTLSKGSPSPEPEEKEP
jgi:integrase